MYGLTFPLGFRKRQRNQGFPCVVASVLLGLVFLWVLSYFLAPATLGFLEFLLMATNK